MGVRIAYIYFRCDCTEPMCVIAYYMYQLRVRQKRGMKCDYDDDDDDGFSDSRVNDKCVNKCMETVYH